MIPPARWRRHGPWVEVDSGVWLDVRTPDRCTETADGTGVVLDGACVTTVPGPLDEVVRLLAQAELQWLRERGEALELGRLNALDSDPGQRALEGWP